MVSSPVLLQNLEFLLKYQPMEPESLSKRLTQVLRVATLIYTNHYILYEQQQKTFLHMWNVL